MQRLSLMHSVLDTVPTACITLSSPIVVQSCCLQGEVNYVAPTAGKYAVNYMRKGPFVVLQAVYAHAREEIQACPALYLACRTCRGNARSLIN
eukprot:1426268-Amphidinium_carterae.1